MATAIENLYNAAHEQYELGTLDSYKEKLGNVDKRKALYDALKDEYDLGDWEHFNSVVESDLNGTSPAIAEEQTDSVSPTVATATGAATGANDALEERRREREAKQHKAAVDAATLPMSGEDVAREARINMLEWQKASPMFTAWMDANGKPQVGFTAEHYITPGAEEEVAQLKSQRPEYLKEKAKSFGEAQEQVLLASIENTEEGKQRYAEYNDLIEAEKYKYQKAEQADHDELQAAVNAGDMTIEEAKAEQARRHESYQKALDAFADKAFEPMASSILEQNKDYLEKENRRLGNDVIESEITKLREEIKGFSGDKDENILSMMPNTASRMGGLDTGVLMDSYSDYLVNALEYLNDAEKIKDATKYRPVGTKIGDKISYHLSELGKGYGENITDVDTWDFGLSQMMRTSQFKDIIEKVEKNNGDESVLTDEEKILLHAGYTFLESCALNSKRLSRAYKAGQTTAESTPFMLEFALGFAGAAENAVARGIIRLGNKMFGKVAGTGARRMTREFIGHALGTATGALVQTALFASPKIIEGSLKRQLGQVNVDTDYDMQQFEFGGIEEDTQQGAWDATKNSILDNYIENLSEMFFTQFNPLTRFGKAWLGSTNMFKELGAKNWVRGLMHAYNNPVFQNIRKRMQFGGYTAEVMEEEVGGLMRLLCSDVNNMKDADLDKDSQIDILLGLLPTSMFFLGVGGAGAVWNGIKTKYNTNELLKYIPTEKEREFFKQLINSSMSSGEFGEKAYDFVRGVVNSDEYTPAQKQGLLSSVAAKYYDVLSDEAKKAADAVAEEQYGEMMSTFADGITYKDGKSYGTLDSNGHPVFITDGYFSVEDKDGVPTLRIPRGKTVKGVYIREDGTLSDEVEFKAKDLHTALEITDSKDLKSFAKDAARARYSGEDTFEHNGKTYSASTLVEIQQPEKATAENQQPAQPSQQQQPAQKRKRVAKKITITEAKKNKVPATVIYDPSKAFYNEDGSIDEKRSEGLVLYDYQGKEIKGDKRAEWIDALNDVLMRERAIARENAQAAIDAKIQAEKQAREDADYKRAVSEARRKRAKEMVDTIKEKDGWIDAKNPNTTAEQIFWYTMTHASLDDAYQEAVEQVVEDTLTIAELRSEEGKKRIPKAQERNAEIHRCEARIKAYEDAIKFWVDATDKAHNVAQFRIDVTKGIAEAVGQPIAETPAQPTQEVAPEQPVVETPAAEVPAAEVPIAETPVAETPVEEEQEEEPESPTARSNKIYDHIEVSEVEENGTKYTVYTPYAKAEGDEEAKPVPGAGIFINSNLVKGGPLGDTIINDKHLIQDIQVVRTHMGEIYEGRGERVLGDLIVTYKDGSTKTYDNVWLGEQPKVKRSMRKKEKKQEVSETPAEAPEKPKAEKPNKPAKSALNPFDENIALVRLSNNKLAFVNRAEIKEGMTEVPKRVVYAKEGGVYVPYIIRSASQKFGPNTSISLVGADGTVHGAYANLLFMDEEGKQPFAESELSSKRKKLKVTSLQQVIAYVIYVDKQGNHYTLADLLMSHGNLSGYEYVRQQVDAENPGDVSAIEELHRSIQDVIARWNSLAETLLDSKGYDAKKLLAYRYLLLKNARSNAFKNGKFEDAHSYDKMMDGPVSFAVKVKFDPKWLSKQSLQNPLINIACMIEITQDMPGVKEAGFGVELPEDIQKALEARIITAKQIEEARAQYKEMQAQEKKNGTTDSAAHRNRSKKMVEMEDNIPEVLNNYTPLTRIYGKEGYEKVKQYYKAESGEKRTERKKSKEQEELDAFDALLKSAETARLEGDMEKYRTLNEQISKIVTAHAKDKVNKFANRLIGAKNRLVTALAKNNPLLARVSRLHRLIEGAQAVPVQRQKKVDDLTEKLRNVNAEIDGLKSMPIDVESNNRALERAESRKEKLEEQLEDAKADLARPLNQDIRVLQEQLSTIISEHPEVEEEYQNLMKEDKPKNGLNVEFSIADEVDTDANSEQAHLVYNSLMLALNKVKGLNVYYVGNQENALAELRKLNGSDNIELFKAPKGTILGWAIGDDIYLTDEGMNSDTPIHEFTHLWVKALRADNSGLWSKIVKELKNNKALWDSVVNDTNYKDLKTDDAIASEVLARYSGKYGSKKLLELAKGQKFGSEKLEQAFINRVRRSLRTFWQWVAEKLFGWAGYKAKYGEESLDDFADMVLRDLFDGKLPNSLTEATQAEMEEIKKKAIEDGTFMKAPNGEQTKLTERQWLLVRTKGFKTWFGDWENDPKNASKVVDENGEPLVVYHGSPNAGFATFKYGHGYSNAIYTTDNKEVTKGYATANLSDYKLRGDAYIGDEAHSGIYSLFANIKNPLRVNFADEEGNPRAWNAYPTGRWICDLRGYGIRVEVFDTKEEAENYAWSFGLSPDWEDLVRPEVKTTDDFVDEARKNGYDGCIFENVYDGSRHLGEPMTDYVVLASNQVKSVTNKGFFSEQEDRIEFSASIEELNNPSTKAVSRLSKGGAEFDAAMTDMSIPQDERATLAHRAIMRMMDRTEGLRLIQNSIAAYREMMEYSQIPDELDVRTLFDSANAAARNKIKELNATKASELHEAVNALADVVEKSRFYQLHKKEVGGKNPAELTPIEFIGRYLIARNNWERAEENKDRGAAEFAIRMGMDMVRFATEFQAAYDEKLITDMWDKIKQLTDYTLDLSVDYGMITEEESERLKAKKYWVPQRGFWDKVNPENENDEGSDEFNARIGKNGRRTNKLSFTYKAEGGKSLAENPFVYIFSDVDEAIVKGEQNKVKRALFDLLRENREWCELPEVGFQVPARVSYRVNEDGEIEKLIEGVSKKERDEIRELDRKITEKYKQLANSTSNEEKMALRQIIQEMQEKRDEIAPEFSAADTRRIYQKRKGRNSVGVLVDGYQCEIILPERFVLTADALNGKEDVEGKLATIKHFSSALAATFTVNNPTFWAVNLARDVHFATLKGGTEYGPMFVGRFYKNLVACQGVLNKYLYSGRMPEASDGKIAEYLIEFLNNGANTGLMNNMDLAKFRYDVQKMNPGNFKTGGKEVAKKIGRWAMLQPVANYMNEWSELTTRFAIYCAVRDGNMSEMEATKAAHNISVNFNRRGLGHQWLNIFSSMTVFVNATVQGVTGFWRTFGGDRKHPVKKALKAACVMAVGPALLGFMNALLMPDDPDNEIMVSRWDRDNYICLPNGIRIPLPQEIRPFWCMGVNIAMLIKGGRTDAEVWNSILTSMLTNGTPLPQNVTNAISVLVENATTDTKHNIGVVMRELVTPTFLETLNQLAEHQNFLGGKLRYDIDDIPEYEMAPNESAFAKDMSWWLYCLGRGDTDTPSKMRVNKEGELVPLRGWADMNPKEIRNYMFMIPSGTLDAWLTIWGIGHDIKDAINGEYEFGKNVRVKDLPVVNRFYHQNNPGLYRYGIQKEAKNILDRWQKATEGAEEAMVRFGALAENTEGAKHERNIERMEKSEARYEALVSNEQMYELESALDEYKSVSMAQRKRDLHLMSDEEMKEVYGVESVEEFDKLEKEAAQNLHFILNEIKGLNTSEKDPNIIEIVEE